MTTSAAYVQRIGWTAVAVVLAGFAPAGGSPATTPGLVPAAAPASSNATGTISGTLESVWVRRYEMVIYLEKIDGTFEPGDEQPVIDQKNKMFVPHVLPVVQGTMVRYVNHDDTKHNVYMVQPDETQLNLGTGMADWSREHEMSQPGVYVHRCNVHDEMAAYVIVLQNPHFTLIPKVSGKTAEFTLEGVPPGDYVLRVWCERFYGDPDNKFNRAWNVTVEAGEVTTVEVKP